MPTVRISPAQGAVHDPTALIIPLAFLSPHTPVGRVRLARFARVRLLRHALPISLLILRKKPTVLQSIRVVEKKTKGSTK